MMTITYVLNEHDYLAHQLYVASKSKRLINRRRKTWLMFSAALFVLGVGFIDVDRFYTYYFLIAGLICLIFYPFYQRYAYKKNYHKYVLDHFQYRFGKTIEVSFQPDFIATKDIAGESKINAGEISEIDEISTHYFIGIKSGVSLIIPKAIIHDPSFLSDVMAIFQNPNISVIRELDWKWK